MAKKHFTKDRLRSHKFMIRLTVGEIETLRRLSGEKPVARFIRETLLRSPKKKGC
jgi:hypothetical protein